MWRKCDLHIHTGPDDRRRHRLHTEVLLAEAQNQHLDVIAVTDHDDISRIEEICTAACGAGIAVVPGVEVSTDRGHVLLYTPGLDDTSVLAPLVARAGIGVGAYVQFDELLNIIRRESTPQGDLYRASVLAVGAHVDRPRSLLSGDQSATHDSQMERAQVLHALEVADPPTLKDWVTAGVKSSGVAMPLVHFSDAHSPGKIGERFTWMYLPEISHEAMVQAFATAEASLAYEGAAPADPDQLIRSVSIEGGLHDGLTIDFSNRFNAIVGPPSVGKSLLMDALRFLFEDTCMIDEVADLSRRRMANHLPDGSVVSAEIEIAGTTHHVSREVGGTAKAGLSMRPIIFSQTELTRRAMAAEPSIDLADVHIEPLPAARQRVAAQATVVASKIDELLRLAETIRSIGGKVDNQVDGLKPTKHRLEELGGREDTAVRANSIETVLEWRRQTRSQVEDWNAPVGELPEVDDLPDLPDSGADLKKWLPRNKLTTRMRQYSSGLQKISSGLAADLLDILGADDQLAAEHEELDAMLVEAGRDDAASLLAELKRLRTRKAQLEQQHRKRKGLLRDLRAAYRDLGTEIERLKNERDEVTRLRKSACRGVNRSLTAFYCKIVTDDRDEIVAGLKALRSGLRTATLMECAVELSSHDLVGWVLRELVGSDSRITRREPSESESRVVDRILEGQEWTHLKALATARVDDRLEIHHKGRGGQAVPFGEMTEGLRALAIKEVSFATSQRPVISDQPEESVPTRSVYDELVPTIRAQRSTRQFIVVSHDANIVVGGDADRIIVLTGDEQRLRVGTLFDRSIAGEALDHLEGGAEAFERRTRRYSALG